LINRPGQTYTISVEKLALFYKGSITRCVLDGVFMSDKPFVAEACPPMSHASGGTYSSTACIKIIARFKYVVAIANVFPHLETWVRVGCGITHVKGDSSTLRLRYSK
jgi:hypothetical protein